MGVPSYADPPADPNGPYAVVLEDSTGGSLRTFWHQGTNFALGEVGERYTVRLENHTGRRVEAVLSVDGRDAISGKVGNYVRERGYVVPAFGTVRVDGFRRSRSETAAFRFSSPSSSYSSRMGTPENVGVVGVAFFPERIVPQPPPRDYYRDEPYSRSAPSKRAAPGASPSSAPRSEGDASGAGHAAPAPEASRSRRGWDAEKDDYRRSGDGEGPSRLGTEYGEARYSPVSEVSFVRQSATSPSVVLRLRYDDEAGLFARGIDVYPRPDWAETAPYAPNPFPMSRFAPPPP